MLPYLQVQHYTFTDPPQGKEPHVKVKRHLELKAGQNLLVWKMRTQFSRIWNTTAFQEKRAECSRSRRWIARLTWVLISSKTLAAVASDSYRVPKTCRALWREFDSGQIRHSERSPLNLFLQIQVVPCWNCSQFVSERLFAEHPKNIRTQTPPLPCCSDALRCAVSWIPRKSRGTIKYRAKSISFNLSFSLF